MKDEEQDLIIEKTNEKNEKYNPNKNKSQEQIKKEYERRKIARRENRAIELACKGVTVAESAKAVELDVRRVGKALKRFFNLDDNATNLQQVLEDYNENRSEILQFAESKMLKSALEKDKLDSATLSQLVNSVEKLRKLDRLESNQSTQNVSIHGVLKED